MTVTQSTIAFRGADLVVREGGLGASIGYLHGTFGNPGDHQFLHALSEHYRVVAPSLPGFDDSSPVDELRHFYDWVSVTSEIVDLAGLAGKALVASSIGAMLALEVAAVRPEAFSSLILIGPLGLWADDDPVTDLFARPQAEERDVLTADPASSAMFYDDDPAMEDVDLVTASVRRYLTRRSVAALIWGVPDHGLAGRLHRVSCPVTLIWGADDRLVPPSYMKRFTDQLPNVAGTHVVDSAGHHAEWDKPLEVAAIVRGTLGES